MIKFFRKIRYDLMEKNKTGKYLKYAIGEIVLVVIGILIALQINNWNEQRKERIQEKIFLKRFEVELNSNLENILIAISLNKSRIHRADFLLRTIDKPQLAVDSSSYFMKSIEHASYTNIPLISDNAFEELKSISKELKTNKKLSIQCDKEGIIVENGFIANEQYSYSKSEIVMENKDLVVFENTNIVNLKRLFQNRKILATEILNSNWEFKVLYQVMEVINRKHKGQHIRWIVSFST